MWNLCANRMMADHCFGLLTRLSPDAVASTRSAFCTNPPTLHSEDSLKDLKLTLAYLSCRPSFLRRMRKATRLREEARKDGTGLVPLIDEPLSLKKFREWGRNQED